MRRCFRGVRLRKRFMGFEPVDGLILLCVYWLGSALGDRTSFSLIALVVVGLLLRLLKFKRLPGVGAAITSFLLMPSHLSALGTDEVPEFGGKSCQD